LDASDANTLFQDAAGTILTSPGEPIGHARDKSGNGFNAVQTTNDDFRPMLREDGERRYFQTDGIDDQLVVPSRMGLSANPALTIVAGIRPMSSTVLGHKIIAIGGAGGGLSPSFGTGGWAWRHGNGSNIFGPVANNTPVVATFDRDANSTYSQSRLRINGNQQSPAGSGNGGSVPTNSDNSTTLFTSPTGTAAAQAHLYALLIFERVLLPSELALAEKYVAEKSGVSL